MKAVVGAPALVLECERRRWACYVVLANGRSKDALGLVGAADAIRHVLSAKRTHISAWIITAIASNAQGQACP